MSLVTPCGATRLANHARSFANVRGVYCHICKCGVCKEKLSLLNPWRRWKLEARAWVKDLKEGLGK